ncbi:MAG TPA: hypothetical protein PLK06_03815 [bacterium]|nr:hypothetical protein [bacterium]
MQKTHSTVEKITQSVGSVPSLILHTLSFGTAFLLGALHLANWDSVLLILTTIVSLEAIYLAIFIQMSVNQNTASLREVEVDVDEIQEDVDEIQKDIDAIEQDVDEIQEDEAEEEVRDAEHKKALDGISQRLHQLLEELDDLKK